MEPKAIRFGGGVADTLLHPLVAIALVLAIILILCLPRKYVIAPLLFTIFTVPLAQVVVAMGVHFTIPRILIIAGLVRLVTSRKSLPTGRFAGGFTSIDRVFTLWAFVSLVTFSFEWMSAGALIKGLGTFLDVLGGYFVLRFLIQDREDVRRAIKVFAVIATVVALCMISEQIAHRNVYALLGGIRSAPAMRGGDVRSQGAFAVYITAGVFGATLLPLFIWLRSDTKSKVAAWLGIIGATVITFTSYSSTPLLAYGAGIVGLCFWPLRNRMRLFRWGCVIVLAGLHLVMKAPVWALISRVDLTGSSSGYHRYMLIDNCIRHFNDWWFLGVKNYNDWGWDMWDTSNQFVANAVSGGLLTLVLFIAIISMSFGRLGAARKVAEGDPKHEWFLWCLCAALLSHVVADFGVAYFDQVQFVWYALLAIISVTVAGAARSFPSQIQELASNHSRIERRGSCFQVTLNRSPSNVAKRDKCASERHHAD
jgi:hypothetical protein